MNRERHRIALAALAAAFAPTGLLAQTEPTTLNMPTIQFTGRRTPAPPAAAPVAPVTLSMPTIVFTGRRTPPPAAASARPVTLTMPAIQFVGRRSPLRLRALPVPPKPIPSPGSSTP